jgi:hypothetical protein
MIHNIAQLENMYIANICDMYIANICDMYSTYICTMYEMFFNFHVFGCASTRGGFSQLYTFRSFCMQKRMCTAAELTHSKHFICILLLVVTPPLLIVRTDTKV